MVRTSTMKTSTAGFWSTLSMVVGLALVLAMTSPARASIADYDEEDEIIVLNATNFDKALAEFKYLFVDFYAPWCSHCKALAPEFTKLAQLIEELNLEVRLAKVDATAEKALAERYKVTGYPTLKLFRPGHEEPAECRTEHTSGEMYVWLKKKMGSPVDKLDTVEAAKELINISIFVVIGFFKDINNSPAAKAYIEAADAIDDIKFGITDNEEIFKEFKITADDAVVLFKKFDEGRVDFTGSNLETVQNIKDLVEYHRLPLVVEFNDETAPRIFRRSLRIHILMFISKAASYFEKKVAEFRKVAEQYRGKLLFVYIDVDPDEYKRVLDYFGLKRSSCPAYRLIELDGNVKYKPDTDEPDTDELVQFIEQVLAGKRKPHLMSEQIPKDWDSKPVKELVGFNFEEVAKDKKKNVIVKFYAPWCNHCKELAPVWDELGEKYKSSEDVVVAKLDATSNEVDGLKITYFPTIKLYPKDSDEEFEFPGGVNKTLDHFVKFIESGGRLPKIPTEDSSSDDKKKDEL